MTPFKIEKNLGRLHLRRGEIWGDSVQDRRKFEVTFPNRGNIDVTISDIGKFKAILSHTKENLR